MTGEMALEKPRRYVVTRPSGTSLVAGAIPRAELRFCGAVRRHR